MKHKIIYLGKDGRPSMLKVYSQMSCGDVYVKRELRRGKKPNNIYLRHYTNNDVSTLSKEPLDRLSFNNSVVIRWGCQSIFETNKETIVYNKSNVLANASNKAIARKTMLKSGVIAPKLFVKSSKGITYPIIARPFKHSKGKNFVVLNNRKEFLEHYQEGWYYSEFINKTEEYRVHCAHGKILGIMQKPSFDNVIAWNKAVNNVPFERVMQKDYKYDVCLEALKAVECLGLDFGGVDVIVKDGKAYVLEVNTAPTLNSSEYISAQYAKYFEWLFRNEKRREHWNFRVFKEASSFAWKQKQLLEN